jgi:Cd2+/Zn2+-exporting ATPase
MRFEPTSSHPSAMASLFRRIVYVVHNVDTISAARIANALSNQGFGAVVKEDAATLLDQLTGIPTDAFVKSSFDLTDSFAGRGEISEVIQACLDLQFTEKQVRNLTVNDLEKNCSLEHNPYYLTAHGIVDILESHMYDIRIVSDGGADGLWALPKMENTEGTIKYQHSTVRRSVILSGVFWVVSMFSIIGGSWVYLEYLALLSVVFGLPPIAVKAFKCLRRRRFDVNCMMFLAAVGALALQDYTESAAVTFLFAVSEVLEQCATSRARNALSDIVHLRPEYANVINPVTNDIVVLPANNVAVGTTVSVRTGDKIPCDGEVIDGTSTVDESSLTGESRPITKSTGMQVSGGTINSGNTQLVIRTTATSNNSAVARLIRLLEEAQANRSETEKVCLSFCSTLLCSL